MKFILFILFMFTGHVNAEDKTGYTERIVQFMQRPENAQQGWSLKKENDYFKIFLQGQYVGSLVESKQGEPIFSLYMGSDPNPFLFSKDQSLNPTKKMLIKSLQNQFDCFQNLADLYTLPDQTKKKTIESRKACALNLPSGSKSLNDLNIKGSTEIYFKFYEPVRLSEPHIPSNGTPKKNPTST